MYVQIRQKISNVISLHYTDARKSSTVSTKTMFGSRKTRVKSEKVRSVKKTFCVKRTQTAIITASLRSRAMKHVVVVVVGDLQFSLRGFSSQPSS